MKILKNKINYFFVDEAGDPIFYNRYGRGIVGEEGCSKILLVGFIKTKNPQELRRAILELREEITAEFIVARKKEEIFRKRHKGKENIFYDDLVAKLFENKLHQAERNIIYFAARGNKTRQAPLSDAIQTAMLTFERKWETKINSEIEILSQTPSGEPCLQITDYMNWAVQRTFQKGDERYARFVREKISYLVDLYDFDSYPKNFYNRKNLFDINKISPL